VSGRIVIITGASSGIGAATAQRFLDDGDNVVNLDLSVDGAPTGCTTIVTDVRQWSMIQRAVDSVVEEYGNVDIAIANAGISKRRDVLGTTHDSMSDVLAINLMGVFGLWQTCAAHMLARGSGVLLATASTNATAAYPYYADYNASKAGVLALCRSFALELSPLIRVACVSPGYVLTPMQRSEYTDEMIAEVNERIPMGRHARPDEIAAIFYFLASDVAAFISGQQIVVDGGELAGGTASLHGLYRNGRPVTAT
jgi:3-oxoacyl-[acyl-carrier protein] reductase